MKMLVVVLSSFKNCYQPVYYQSISDQDTFVYARAVSWVSVELKTNVSEISSVSLIRVDVVNGGISLIFIPVCQIIASSYWCIVQ
jgi:hypothetical protein